MVGNTIDLIGYHPSGGYCYPIMEQDQDKAYYKMMSGNYKKENMQYESYIIEKNLYPHTNIAITE